MTINIQRIVMSQPITVYVLGRTEIESSRDLAGSLAGSLEFGDDVVE